MAWLLWEIRTVHAPLYSSDLGWAGAGRGRQRAEAGKECLAAPCPVPLLTPQSCPGRRPATNHQTKALHPHRGPASRYQAAAPPPKGKEGALAHCRCRCVPSPALWTLVPSPPGSLPVPSPLSTPWIPCAQDPFPTSQARFIHNQALLNPLTPIPAAGPTRYSGGNRAAWATWKERSRANSVASAARMPPSSSQAPTCQLKALAKVSTFTP